MPGSGCGRAGRLESFPAGAHRELHRLRRAGGWPDRLRGKAAAALFAVALLDAAIIGAFAVSLSTAYTIGDVLGLKHSRHRGVRQAKGF